MLRSSKRSVMPRINPGKVKWQFCVQLARNYPPRQLKQRLVDAQPLLQERALLIVDNLRQSRKKPGEPLPAHRSPEKPRRAHRKPKKQPPGSSPQGFSKIAFIQGPCPCMGLFLQFLRELPSHREGNSRRNCKKSSRSPQATMLKGQLARLKAICAKPGVLQKT